MLSQKRSGTDKIYSLHEPDNFTEPMHDSKTLPEVLEMDERLKDKETVQVFADRGYIGTIAYWGLIVV